MKTILILHGWGSCAKNWNFVKKLLEEQGYKVFIPDLPGFGENPPPPQIWSIDDYAEWVRNYCEQYELSRFFLLGHSFGGSIAVKFSIKEPEKIEKLFLVGCAGIRKKSLKREIIKKTANFFKKFDFLPLFNLLRKVFYKLIKSDYLQTQGVIREIYLKILKQDISKDFSKISVPTVLIWGKKDNLTPLKDAHYIKGQISGAKLEILPGIYHNPHRENPKALICIILNYLK